MENIKQHLLVKTLSGLIVGVCITTLFGAFFITRSDPELKSYYLDAVVTGSVLISLFALPIGLLIHSILYANKWRQVAPYALCGMLSGVGYGAISYKTSIVDNIWDLAAYGLWAAAIAFIAWLIRRPDKDVKPLP